MKIILALSLLACSAPATTVRRSALTSGAACYDPVDYGATPAAARVGAQAAIDAAAAAGGGRVCFGAGKWSLDRAPIGSYNRFAALSTHGKHITISGVGDETILDLAGDQGNSTTILISIDPSAEYITVENLRLRSTDSTNTDEQTHAIATSGNCSGATCQPIRHVTIDRVSFEWPRNTPSRKGDCIRLLGNSAPAGSAPGTELYGVRVTNVTGDCARSFVEIQRGVHDLVIAGNTINCETCDQDIDGEATGILPAVPPSTIPVGAPTKIVIANNTFTDGIGTQGDSSISLTSVQGATITGNTLPRGIAMYRSTGVTITGNTIASLTTAGDTGVIDVQNVCEGLAITGNVIKRGGHIGPVIKLVPHSNVSCSGFVVSGNVLTQGTVFHTIYMESASRALVASNMITYPAAAGAYSAIYMRSVYASAPVTTLGIVGNVISGAVTYAVTLDGSPGSFGAGVAVTNNIAPNTTFGVRLNNSGFTSPVTITGNVAGPSAYGGNAVSQGD